MSKIRLTLLGNIIGNSGVYQHKYSTGFNSLKSIMKLESKETQNKLPLEMFDRFKELEDNLTNINPKVKGIPLLVLEQYFLRNTNNLNNWVYIEYGKKGTDLRIVDLYLMLETWFSELYLLASEIADYYNYEVKMKSSSEEDFEMV